MFRVPVSALLIAAAVALAACQPPAAPKSSSDAATKTAPAAEATKPLGDFSKTGTILEVGDAGYPMFVLKIDFRDGQPPEEMLFNNEAVKAEGLGEDIATAKGKAVEVGFTRKSEHDLLTMTLIGKSLLAAPETGTPPTPEGTVTGVLSGATALTAGDLPDQLTVTEANGKTHNFEWFISERDLVAANGKEVTAGYRNTVRVEVTALRATK